MQNYITQGTKLEQLAYFVIRYFKTLFVFHSMNYFKISF